MTTPEPLGTTAKFYADITARVDYFRQEFDITYAQAVGVLMLIVGDLSAEVREQQDEEQP